MLMSDYLNPNTIFLEHLEKSSSSEQLRTCDFCISDYGIINNLGIVFDDSSGCKISCDSVSTQRENGPKLYLYDSERGKLPKNIAFTNSYPISSFHENFQKETDSENLIRSLIFNLFLIIVFDDVENISQIDFTLLGNRSNNLFFLEDPTKDLIHKIEKDTFENLNKIENQENVIEYWKSQIYYNDSIIFRNDDLFYTYYTISLNAENNILNSNSFVSQKLIKNINFVLSWVLNIDLLC